MSSAVKNYGRPGTRTEVENPNPKVGNFDPLLEAKALNSNLEILKILNPKNGAGWKMTFPFQGWGDILGSSR